MRVRFSIAYLMGVVLLFGLGLAALKSPTDSRASLIFTATVAVLLTSTLASMIRRRWTWGGFALFGWASLLLAFGPTEYATQLPRPLSTMILEALLPTFGPPTMFGPDRWLNVVTVVGVRISGRTISTPVAYLQVGNCVLSLVAALVGGLAGHLIGLRMDER